MQEYTTKLRKMAIMLGTSLKNPNVLLNYLGGYTESFMEASDAL